MLRKSDIIFHFVDDEKIRFLHPLYTTDLIQAAELGLEMYSTPPPPPSIMHSDSQSNAGESHDSGDPHHET